MTVYLQETAPSSPVSCDEWRIPSTGLCYIRNTSNNAWVIRMNANQTGGGVLATSGGDVSGTLTINDPYGYSLAYLPLTNANMLFDEAAGTYPSLNGVHIATEDDIEDLEDDMFQSIDDKVRNSINSAASIQSNNLVVVCGELDFTNNGAPYSITTLYDALTAQQSQQIFLPYFPDGLQATEDQCSWIVFANTIASYETTQSTYIDHEYKISSCGFYNEAYESVEPSEVLEFKCLYFKHISLDGITLQTSYYGPLVKYVIVARR